jgi:prepilin-type N-terminal cleavage/methylation domain-containing protein
VSNRNKIETKKPGYFKKMKISSKKRCARNVATHSKTVPAAFTIIELLVVVSIISLLLAVLVPALRKAKEQTRATICMSNLKQWSLSYQIYATENNSKYPPAEPQNTKDIWMTRMSNYCSDIQTLRNCPSAIKMNNTGKVASGILGATRRAWYLTAPFDLPPQYRTGSYTKNLYTGQLSLEDENNSNRVSSNYWTGPEDRGAGQAPLLIDGRWYVVEPEDNDPLPMSEQVYISESNKTSVDSLAMNRHKDGVNTLFVSGTIIKVKAEELWNLKWNKTYEKRGKVNLSNLSSDM